MLRPTDAAVIEASITDPPAFATVFDRHWDRISRFCVSRTGAAGEDIAAETFRVAFDQRAMFHGRGSGVQPWLFGIATNLIRHFFRSAARGRRAASRLDPGRDADQIGDAIERIEAEQLGPNLSLALASLRAAQRDTFLLHAWEDLTYEEIASALDISVGTVRTRIHRARTALRAHLSTTTLQDQS